MQYSHGRQPGQSTGLAQTSSGGPAARVSNLGHTASNGSTSRPPIYNPAGLSQSMKQTGSTGLSHQNSNGSSSNYSYGLPKQNITSSYKNPAQNTQGKIPTREEEKRKTGTAGNRSGSIVNGYGSGQTVTSMGQGVNSRIHPPQQQPQAPAYSASFKITQEKRQSGQQLQGGNGSFINNSGSSNFGSGPKEQTSGYQYSGLAQIHSQPSSGITNSSMMRQEYEGSASKNSGAAFDYLNKARQFAKPEEEEVKRFESQMLSDSFNSKLSLGDKQSSTSVYSMGNGTLGSQSTAMTLQKASSAGGGPMGTLKSLGPGAPPGLRNIGNTCFMNSILQCIFATPFLNDWFLNEYSGQKLYKTQRLSKAYFDLIRKVKNSMSGSSSSSYDSSITPSELKMAVSYVAPQFSGYGQQDAQEFLRFLLDGLHEELNRIPKKPPYQELDFDRLPIDQQSEKWWDYYIKRDDSIITDLFTGQLMNRLRCEKCGHSSYAFDNFMDLSISIPRSGVRITGKVELKDCLESYIKPEKMEPCGFKCTKCHHVDNFTKELTIFRFPKILVVHLKRFYNSAMRREKLNTSVQIPLTQDFSTFAPNSNHESKKLARYKLYGISHHSGTLYGGHYIAEAMNIGTGKWYDCNDSWVKQISGPESDSASAYVLFYVQQSHL